MKGSRLKVLVVDDDRDTANSMADLLVLWGYEAEPMYSGNSALAAIRLRRPAAVLLDIGMAPMSGFEFATLLRDLPGRDRTTVVAISGYTGEAYRARSRTLGIAHYLVKPVDLNLLQAILRGMVEECNPPQLRGELATRSHVSPRTAKSRRVARRAIATGTGG